MRQAGITDKQIVCGQAKATLQMRLLAEIPEPLPEAAE
jgi:hypothetical protein